MLTCVVNISEGRRADVVAAIGEAAGDHLLDVHTDAHHHRSVLTLGGPAVEDAARAVARAALARLHLAGHDGVHPRIGVLDVVPFVPVPGTDATLADAAEARDRFGAWAADELALPGFAYGEAVGSPSLPEIRRRAFRDLAPTWGPPRPHPSAGAVAVGARPLLVAWNVWLTGSGEEGVAAAKRIAAGIRSPAVRALGLDVGGQPQVSCNLVTPSAVGPGAVYAAVAERAEAEGLAVVRCELVGLVPATVLDQHRDGSASHRSLDLDPSRTIEARLRHAGFLP